MSGYTARTIDHGSRNITKSGLDSSGARLLPPGSILFSSRAPIGYVAIAKTTLATNQGFKNFIPPAGLSSEFLHYYLQYAKPLAVELASGTTFPEISGKRAAEIPVALAPEQEQKNIVIKLDELFSDLDAGVASLRRARANLKRYRATVLQSAVTGRLTAGWRARNPATETGAHLLARLLQERRQRWERAQLAKFEAAGTAPPKDWRRKYAEPTAPSVANLPELPGGWCWTTVDQLLGQGLSNGRSVPTASEGFPVLRLTAIRGGEIDDTQAKTGAWSREQAEPHLISAGDFLIARGNGSLHLVGRGGVVKPESKEVAFPDTMIRARFGLALVPSFIRWLWDSRHVRNQIEAVARTSAGIYKVSQSDLEQISIPLPPTAEQVEIVAGLDHALALATRADADIDASLRGASTLRNAILKRAFSGSLVPQDPLDEPASALLERILASRARGSGQQGRRAGSAPQQGAARQYQCRHHGAPQTGSAVQGNSLIF